MDAMDVAYLSLVVAAFLFFLGLIAYADATTRR